MSSSFRVLTWNITNGGGEKLRDRLQFIISQKPDIIALQEARASTWERFNTNFNDLLNEEGFTKCNRKPTTHCHLAGPPTNKKHPNGQIILSKWKIIKKLPSIQPPLNLNGWKAELVKECHLFGESLLSVVIQTPWKEKMEFHSIHIPAASNFKEKPHPEGLTKVYTEQAVYERLARKSNLPQIIVGDLNTPRAELLDGGLVTGIERPDGKGGKKWGPNVRKRTMTIRGMDAYLWRDIECNLLRGLEKFDVYDVFRLIHGNERLDATTHRRGRYDHIFSSLKLNPIACEHLDGYKLVHPVNLEEHSPVIADFAPN